MSTTCDVRDRIIDAECLYQDGKFTLASLPACLPKLFTVRFRSTADFGAGDVFVVDEREYTVLTSQMEPAEASCFKAGAVVLCEIDRDRKLAFIRTGSAGSGDVEFQTSDLVYYIDPLGDDSPNNPGGVDSPFKTLAGAGRAAWESIVMNPLGKLVFSFNPGTYELTTADRTIMTEATHPLGIRFIGTDLNNKPLLISNDFNSNYGDREYQGLRLQATVSTGGRAMGSFKNATIIVRDSEIIINKSNIIVLGPTDAGFLRIHGSVVIDANNSGPSAAFHNHMGMIRIVDATVSFKNFGPVSLATMFCDTGNIQITRTTFSGAVPGKRYDVVRNGVINTNRAGNHFIPGTIDGTTSLDGKYY